MAVAGVQQTSPMCVFVRIVCQKIINYINKLVSILEGVSEAVAKCCISTSPGTSVAAIVPFFERDCAAQTLVAAVSMRIGQATSPAQSWDRRRRPARQKR